MKFGHSGSVAGKVWKGAGTIGLSSLAVFCCGQAQQGAVSGGTGAGQVTQGQSGLVSPLLPTQFQTNPNDLSSALAAQGQRESALASKKPRPLLSLDQIREMLKAKNRISKLAASDMLGSIGPISPEGKASNRVTLNRYESEANRIGAYSPFAAQYTPSASLANFGSQSNVPGTPGSLSSGSTTGLLTGRSRSRTGNADVSGTQSYVSGIKIQGKVQRLRSRLFPADATTSFIGQAADLNNQMQSGATGSSGGSDSSAKGSGSMHSSAFSGLQQSVLASRQARAVGFSNINHQTSSGLSARVSSSLLVDEFQALTGMAPTGITGIATELRASRYGGMMVTAGTIRQLRQLRNERSMAALVPSVLKAHFSDAFTQMRIRAAERRLGPSARSQLEMLGSHGMTSTGH